MKGKAKKGQSGTSLVMIPWSVCLSLVTIDVLCPMAEGRSEGLFSRCGKSKPELCRKLELPESLCCCPFSDSHLDRRLALRLPMRDLSVQIPLSLTLPSLFLQWLCKSVRGSSEDGRSWDFSQAPIAWDGLRLGAIVAPRQDWDIVFCRPKEEWSGRCPRCWNLAQSS